MYAIIETGGKQYRVKSGDIVDIEHVDQEVNKTFNFEKILAVVDGKDMRFGTPTVEGATVSASLLENRRDKKLVVFKMKRRKGSRRKKGHRQALSRVKIEEIKTPE